MFNFFYPSLKFPSALKQNWLTNLLQVLQTMWDMPTYNCYLNFTNVSMKGFDVNWILSEVQNEVTASETSLLDLQREVAKILSMPAPASQIIPSSSCRHPGCPCCRCHRTFWFRHCNGLGQLRHLWYLWNLPRPRKCRCNKQHLHHDQLHLGKSPTSRN